MKIKMIFLFMLFAITVGCTFSQTHEGQLKKMEKEKLGWQKKINTIEKTIDSLKLLRDFDDIKRIALPAYNSDKEIVEHSAMVLLYNEDHEQADWVAHKISVDITSGAVGRTNDFRTDPLVSTKTAEKKDYWHSGYDRGHLAPSADFRWSRKALSESYFYSNMSPQRPKFNREIWADLENALRKYVVSKQEPLYVVTGPYYSESPKFIGSNKVSVPPYYYKTALDYTGDTISAIAFLMPNEACEYPVLYYAMSVDSLESITGRDFYANIPDSIEQQFESELNMDYWAFISGKRTYIPIHRSKLPRNTINTVQARSYYDKRATVCGTVSSVHKSAKGHVFLNFDGEFPDQLFWCTIWKSEMHNFSYDPEEYLLNKKVCVRGVIKKKYGKPSMGLNNEKDIQTFEYLISQ
ncbi:MAG: DNA/RNA non-specific endonuclease [Bacteroidota bacterium]|nr:DNA/RNA non-specific endonuclease [Bacteroidota bacterium]